MLPALRLSDEQLHYREPWVVAFEIGITPPPELLAREVNTNTLAAEVDQPLLGLARLSQDRAALLSAAGAAQSDARSAEAEVREEVETGVLHLYEARAMAGIAAASEEQLTQELQVMQAKFRAGVATTADVLRVEVAVANARQQEIQARVDERVSRALLLALLGRDQDDLRVDFTEPTLDEDRAEGVPELGAAIDQAVVHRPELASAQLSALSARQHARARALALLPDLDLEASWVHIQGEALAPVYSAYVGIKATWTAFEWGAGLFDERAAADQASAAQAASSSIFAAEFSRASIAM